MQSMATSFYKLHYNEAIAPHFTLDEKQDMAQKISELTLRQPIWLDKDADWIKDFPELAPYVNTALSGLYLCAILEAIVDEFGREPNNKERRYIACLSTL